MRYNEDMSTIFAEASTIVNDYKSSKIQIEDGFSFSQFQTIKRITYYSHSEYMSGKYDELGREKPFGNIVNSAVNVAVRATDFNTRDINLIATEPQFYTQSFFARKEVQNWMEDVRFDKTLNDMSETRARYGSVLVKRVEKKDNLHIDVVSWRNVATDQVNIENNPIVEIHYMSQLDLSRMRSAWDGLAENWYDIMEIFDEQAETAENKETLTDRIEVLEIEGELKKMFLPEYADDENVEDWENVMQKQFIINYGEDKQFCLYHEELKDGSNYRKLDWESVDGRGIGRGIVELGFQAQTWYNDGLIRENQVAELGGKLLFKTSDDLVYDNVLTDADNGSILKLDGGDLQPLNTMSNAYPQFSNQRESWKAQFTDATSTYAGITGEPQPANTPLGSVQLQNSEARSIFDYRRQQMGIFLEDLIEEWVLPYLMKKLNRKHILNAEFTREELNMIDTAFAMDKANKEAIDDILDGKLVTALEFDEKINKTMEELALGKNRRYIEIPDNFFKNMKAKVRVVTTNEKYNKQVVLQSMTQLLSLAPTLKEQPELMPLFARIIEMSGIGVSPLEILPKFQPDPLQPQEQGGDKISATEAKEFGKAVAQPEKITA